MAMTSKKYGCSKIYFYMLLFVTTLTLSMLGQHYLLIWIQQETELTKSFYIATWEPTNKQSIDAMKISSSCRKIISGDMVELQKADAAMSLNVMPGLRDVNYTQTRTHGCSTVVKYENYIHISMTKDEKDFPIAFSIIVYRDLAQVERLLRAIWRPNNVYCVFVDSKSKPEFTSAVRAIMDCFSNVVVPQTEVNVRWGTFSVLEPDLLCMDILWRSKTKWKYFINLTGQEYPLKTNYEIVQILKAYRGANDIMGRLKRVKRERFEDAGLPPFGIQAVTGPVHIIACRGYVNYVLHNRVALALRNWVKHTRVPDETFFSTLNYNPQLHVPGSYTGNVTNGKLTFMGRYKLWHPMHRCSGQVVRGICIMEIWNLQHLVHAPDLFVNKFVYDHHPLAYDCLEEWYLDKVGKELAGELDFNTTLYDERWMVTHHF